MTDELHDSDLQLLLLEADPLDVVALHRIADTAGATELRHAIVGEPAPSGGRHHRRRLAVLAVAAVAAVAVPLGVTVLAPTSTRESAYAAQAVQFAKQSPRLLVAAPGWHVTDLNQDYADSGEMTFAHGRQSFDVEWNTPASTFGPVSDQVGTSVRARIDGHRALVGRVPASGPKYFAALWSVGDQGLRARGQFADLEAFLAVVRTLHHVGVTNFLAALPASVVTPDGLKTTVADMLADIPQPPGFDTSGLTDSTLLLDRYQLGAHVTSAVSCGWLDLWLNGDDVQQFEASRAMATSRRWAILREMAPEGGWSQSIWQSSDNMNGEPIAGRTPDQTVSELLKNHLGC